jgi:hypothetical protein
MIDYREPPWSLRKRTNQIGYFSLLSIAALAFFTIGHSWDSLGVSVMIGLIVDFIYAPRIWWRRSAALFVLFVGTLGAHGNRGALGHEPWHFFFSLGFTLQNYVVALAAACLVLTLRTRSRHDAPQETAS